MSQIPTDQWHASDTFKRLRAQNLVNGVNNQIQGVDGQMAELHNPGMGRGMYLPTVPPFNSNPAVIWGANNSGNSIKRGYAAYLSSPFVVLTPSSANAEIEAFLDAPVLVVPSGSAPASAIIGIALASIGAVGEAAFGPFAVSGVVGAAINIQNASDTSAIASNNAGDPLLSGAGPINIIWVPGGVGTATSTGMQFGYVQLGGGGTGTLPVGELPDMMYGDVTVNGAGIFYDRLHSMT